MNRPKASPARDGGSAALLAHHARLLAKLSVARFEFDMAKSDTKARRERCRAALGCVAALKRVRQDLGVRRIGHRCGLHSPKALALDASDRLPTEIRLFTRGVNQTEKGPYLFDDEAAKRVMAHYADRGVDVMIDLEHLSTDDASPNYDPDARGWAKLEVRNGELWATGVTWTADGAARVSEKRQRYVSPYLAWEELPNGQRRIVELMNFAIVANPATHDPPRARWQQTNFIAMVVATHVTFVEGERSNGSRATCSHRRSVRTSGRLNV